MDVLKQRAQFSSLKHFGSLDGLRCISIVAVIWSHGPGQASLWPILRSGRRGVDLFFAISGFLITTLLLRERDANGGISLRRFYLRRSLRIFPLYYAVFLVYLAGILTRPHTKAAIEFLHNVPYFLTYTANWFVSRTAVFAFAWSLSTEEQFYCIWPSVEKFLGRWAAPLMAATVPVLIAIQFHWIPLTGFPRTVATSIAYPICFGVLLAHLLHHPYGYRIGLRLFGFPGAPVVAFAAACAVLSVRSGALVSGICLTLVVATCVVREDHCLGPVLQLRPIQKMGEVSYGMYLFHGLIYNVTGAIPGLSAHGIPAFLLATTLTVGVASLSYRYYESFFLRLKKRFETVRNRPAAQSAAAT